MRLPIALLASALVFPAALAHADFPPSSQPNLLLIVLDDIGAEHLERYQFGQEGFADTEELDEWTDLLLRFEDAWSNPECSPTRSTFHTGKYAHQTGVGRVVNCDGDPCAIDEDCCSGFCSATGPTGFCFEPTPLSDCP